MVDPAGSVSTIQARLVAGGILFGAVTFAVAVPILLQANGGNGYGAEPLPILDWVAVGTAVVLGTTATLFHQRALAAGGAAGAASMATTIATVALLEGGMLFACVTWLLNATAMPNAVTFGALFVLALRLLSRKGPPAAGQA